MGLVPPNGHAPILDVCTGTGDLAFAYFKAGNGDIAVTGTDFCGEMLDLARKKQDARRRNWQKQNAGIEFIEADTTQLPFPSNQFQIVSVAFGLRNVSDTSAGLREMIRVAKPGGRVAVLEFSKPTWIPFRWVYDAYFNFILPRIGQRMAPNPESAYQYLPESVGQFPCGQSIGQRDE